MSQTTTNETGWTAQRVDDGSWLSGDPTGDPLRSPEHAIVFESHELILKYLGGYAEHYRAVKLTRTITVEIGEPEP